MTTPLRVLVLEDRPADAELMVLQLHRADFSPIWWRVETSAEYAAALDRSPEVILADYSLPQFDALSALRLLQARGLDIPFVVVTATVSEEAAVDCMRRGAADYLLKDRLSRLGEAVRQVLAAKEARDEKRRAEEALRQANEALEAAVVQRTAELQEAVRLRDQLLASISHDLKNPLTTIKAQAQLLRRQVLRDGSPDVRRLVSGLESIDAAAGRMTNQIDELLDVACFQLGRPVALHIASTDLVGLAKRIAGEQQQCTDRHQIRVIAPLSEVVGDWDPGRVERVLANLLSNAVKYSPDGGEITVTLRLEGQGEEAMVELAVQDRGIGIPAADLPHVFQRFHRARNVPDQILGTGIGLWGARQIVEQHGGTIMVSSEQDRGTTALVRLPLSSRRPRLEAVAER